MPSDANGVYSLPDGYLAVTGTTVLASQHNPPLEDLAASMTQRVMASGVTPFTGPIKAADGTVAAPAITFASATSSGIYKTADGYGLSISGVQVAEFTSGGLTTGAQRFIGELFPYTGSTAPARTVLAYGQTLSRTTYAALWAFAQTEIAAGNTLYNNGNGSTTFGIMDMRGRGTAGKDNMGGSAASRLTTAGGGVDGATLGAAGGSQSTTLLTVNLPAYTPTGTVATDVKQAGGAAQGQGILFTGANNIGMGGTATGAVQSPLLGISTFTGVAQGGTSTAFSNVPPAIVTNYLLFAGA